MSGSEEETFHVLGIADEQIWTNSYVLRQLQGHEMANKTLPGLLKY